MATSSLMPTWTSTFRSVPFALAISDWTLSSNSYIATFSSNFITKVSKEIVLFDETLEHSSSCILIDKIQGGGGLTFTAESVPDGTITGTIYLIDRDDGKVPVLLENTVVPITNGGTGANTSASAITNLGIDTLLTNLQNQITTQISQAIAAAKLAMYPVGSIYISINETNPSTFIGGTWEKIEGKFLLGASAEFSLGSEGGTTIHSHTTQNHTLTVNEMPSHQHATTNYHGGGNATGFVVANAGPHGDRNYWNFYNPGYSSYTGGSAPHNHGETTEVNILPPYLSVAMWQRTA